MDELFDRERRAGYDPQALAQGIVCLVGAGALASNVAQNFAMCGVGELRLTDFDVIELTNLTRSPLFPRESVRGSKPRFKSRTLASEVLRLSYAEHPIVRSAITQYEELGLGFFEGVSVIVSAVDSFAARADLSDIARCLGIPFVEAGFRGSSGNISVFANRAAEEPCFRCTLPRTAIRGGVSCALYARQVVAEGRTPATQSVAALFGALVAEAAIAAIHGEVPLSGHTLSLDLRSGKSVLANVTADPMCPGSHTIWEKIEPVEVSADEPVATLLRKAGAPFTEPALRLPRPYVVSAPCERCGRAVNIQTPAWRVKEPPACKSCPEGEVRWGVAPQVLTSIGVNDSFAKRPLSRFGIRPRDVLEIEDQATGDSRVVLLMGSIDDLLLTWTHEPTGGKGAKAVVEVLGEGPSENGSSPASTEDPPSGESSRSFFARK